ncbi:MAG: DUF1080 domain-containing protein [Planctomycetaceae bacterium]|jgi:hypothetical protein|nr:DUF1080 domain-containing protein [Planctomycetaceae bacterium]
MFLFFILFLLAVCIPFFQSGELSAQILLDSTPGLVQQNTTSQLTNPAENKTSNKTSGDSSPFYNPFFDNTKKTDFGNLDSLNSSPTLPSPFSGSATGKLGVTPNDFSVGTTSNVPSYGTFYGTSRSFFRPGMTREEYVLRQAEEARMREYNREEQESMLRRQLEIEKGIRNGIYSLFNESYHYLPKVLAEDFDSAENLSTSQSAPSKNSSLSNSSDSSASSNSSNSPKLLTPDELFEQELKAQKIAAEALEDSEQKQRELEALKKRENDRKRWLQQRAEAEHGAKLFNLSPSLRLKDKMLKEGWCLLFDGQTFFGWRTQNEGPYGGGRFIIANNEIQSDPQHPGLLYTTNQFGDSTIMFEFLAEEDAEAFLLLRTPPNPKDLHSSCYTIVLNSANFTRPRGTVLGRQQPSTEQFKEQEKTRENTLQESVSSKKAARWHRLKAQFEAGRLQITVDQNEPIVLFDVKPLGYGYLGLLVTKGKVRFRNMYWLTGSSMPIYDPINPEKHWRYHGDVIQLSMTRDLAMQLNGGPGVVETKESFDNFVLQLEYNIIFSSARTGLFLRSIPREEQTGYEISIQNFPKRQDREQTVGVDAGSFRGKKNARYIRPEDHIWNYLTVVAIDRHFQTWVNGIPVCEMSDNRPLKAEDSKTGPFLLPGTIQLLAPQADTNVQFRNIRIMPVRPRFEKPQTFDDLTKTTWEELSKARKEREREQNLDKQMISEKAKSK